MRFSVIISACLILISQPGFAQMPSSCQQAFSPRLAFLSNLVQLRLRLDQHTAEGHQANKTSLEREFEAKLIEFAIETGKTGVSEVKREIRELMSDVELAPERNSEVSSRREAEVDAIPLLIDGSRIDLHKVEPGVFTANDYYESGARRSGLFEISKPFYLGATSVTHTVWKRVLEAATSVGLNTSDLKNSVLGTRGSDAFLPQEGVSAREVDTWIDLLNELVKRNHPLIRELNPRHIKGGIYRLPTEAEYLLVATRRGQLIKNFPFPEQELTRFAWTSASGSHPVQPVATKDPLIVDGNEYYDLYGNVDQILFNRSNVRSSLMDTGRDQKGEPRGAFVVLRGGSTLANDQGCYRRMTLPIGTKQMRVGFRLVMELPEP